MPAIPAEPETADRAVSSRGHRWWIQSFPEGDGFVEKLMTNCSSCGQPEVQATILRLNKAEMQFWNEGVRIENHSSRRETNHTGVGGFIGLACSFIIFGKMYPSPTSLPIALALVALCLFAPGFVPAYRRWKRRWRSESKALKLAAMVRYPEIDLDEVGDVKDINKFVVAPIGWSPA